jgi:hypothetical protein
MVVAVCHTDTTDIGGDRRGHCHVDHATELRAA